MKKKYRTFIHTSAILYDKIYISAGIRGEQLELNPKDLEKIIDIKFEEIAHAIDIS
jgi:Cys-tRNA(Pro)/Cys-tRNA(Cys) deacylase